MSPPISPTDDDNWRRWPTPSALWEKLHPLAAEKRHNPTAAEHRLWNYLRDYQLHGAKFRRQHGIERFIVDFICPSASLVIEVDGPIHEYTPVEDAIRQEFLESQGYRVMRFTNAQVLQETEQVLAVIAAALHDASTDQPRNPEPD